MKSLKQKLVLGWIVFGAVALGTLPAHAEEVSLHEARKMTEALIQYRYDHYILGVFKETQHNQYNDKMFSELEAILDQSLPGAPHRVDRVDFESDTVKLHAKFAGSDQWVNITANHTGASEGTSSSSVAVAELLGLTINEVDTFESSDHFTFAQVTQGYDRMEKGIPVSGQISAGIHTPLFTLSVFSRQTMIGVDSDHTFTQNGVAAVVPLARVAGIDFSLYAEASRAMDANIVIQRGSAEQAHADAYNAVFRLEAKKQFALSGITASGGVKFVYAGIAGFNQESLKIAFLQLSKSFRNRSGQEVASISILGTHEFAGAKNDWMASIMVSMEF